MIHLQFKKAVYPTLVGSKKVRIRNLNTTDLQFHVIDSKELSIDLLMICSKVQHNQDCVNPVGLGIDKELWVIRINELEGAMDEDLSLILAHMKHLLPEI